MAGLRSGEIDILPAISGGVGALLVSGWEWLDEGGNASWYSCIDEEMKKTRPYVDTRELDFKLL
jgi:hypothetical protein